MKNGLLANDLDYLTDDFNITSKGTFYWIKNISSAKCLERQGDNVIEETCKEGEQKQLWKKGKLSMNCSFTLGGSESAKVLTTNSIKKFEIKGNKTVDICIISYHYQFNFICRSQNLSTMDKV